VGSAPSRRAGRDGGRSAVGSLGSGPPADRPPRHRHRAPGSDHARIL